MRAAALLGLGALTVGLGSLRGGDPEGALALLAYAEREESGALEGPLHLDAARELSRVKPWQANYSTCRRALSQILSERRRAYE